MKSLSFLLPLSLAITAYAHGHVRTVTIGGTPFHGADPFGEAKPATDGVVRVVQSNGPAHRTDNPDLNCGLSASAVNETAVGNAGDEMQFTWVDIDDWIHDTGPIMTYMASCTNGDCSTFDTTKAKWFKIDEQGVDPATGQWAQAKLFVGATANVTIPKTLKAGQYMVRHEIIALHLATTKFEAEFYPSCLQLEVIGDGTEGPSDDELVEFPGAYHDDDPGIFVNAYDNAVKVDYQFPGPKVAAFVSTSRPSTTESSSEPSASTSSAPIPSESAETSGSVSNNASSESGSSSSKTCTKKRSVDKRDTYKPRYYSRIMRDLMFEGL